jgi:hypothetical protein
VEEVAQLVVTAVEAEDGHRYQNAQFGGYNGENVNVRPYALAVHTFVPQFDNELGFSEGDMVFLTRQVDGDWMQGETDGQTGIFPKSYVNIVVDVSPRGSIGCLADLELLSLEPSQPTAGILQQGSVYRVAFSFEAEVATDLSLAAGEEVTVLEHSEPNWALVRNQGGREGQCPVNHLNTCPEPTNIFDGGGLVASGRRRPSQNNPLKFFDPLCSPDEEMLQMETELIRRAAEKPEIPISRDVTLHTNINLPPLNGDRPRHRFKSSTMGKEQSIESFITQNLVGLGEAMPGGAPPPALRLPAFQPDTAAPASRSFHISDSVRQELLEHMSEDVAAAPRPEDPPPARAPGPLEGMYEDPDSRDPPLPARPDTLESLYAQVKKGWRPAPSLRSPDPAAPPAALASLPPSPSHSSCIIYEELPLASSPQTVTVQINHVPGGEDETGPEGISPLPSPPGSPLVPKRTTSIFQRFQAALSRGDTFKAYISEFPPDQEAFLSPGEDGGAGLLAGQPPRPATTPLRSRSVFYNSVLSDRSTPSLPSLSHRCLLSPGPLCSSYETLNGSDMAEQSYRTPHRPAPAPPGEALVAANGVAKQCRPFPMGRIRGKKSETRSQRSAGKRTGGRSG